MPDFSLPYTGFVEISSRVCTALYQQHLAVSLTFLGLFLIFVIFVKYRLCENASCKAYYTRDVFFSPNSCGFQFRWTSFKWKTNFIYFLSTRSFISVIFMCFLMFLLLWLRIETYIPPAAVKGYAHCWVTYWRYILKNVLDYRLLLLPSFLLV